MNTSTICSTHFTQNDYERNEKKIELIRFYAQHIPQIYSSEYPKKFYTIRKKFIIYLTKKYS